MQSDVITVIPVYNGERFLLRTLQSVANQTQKPDRLVVLDNCSTDSTEKIVREFEGIKCEYVRNRKRSPLYTGMTVMTSDCIGSGSYAEWRAATSRLDDRETPTGCGTFWQDAPRGP
jgi:hypothetical protein